MSADSDDTARFRIAAPLIAMLPASLRKRITVGSAWTLAVAIFVAAGGAYRNSVSTAKDIEALKSSVQTIENNVGSVSSIATDQATLRANQLNDEREIQSLREWRESIYEKAEQPVPFRKKK
jgi:hypothetical protein